MHVTCVIASDILFNTYSALEYMRRVHTGRVTYHIILDALGFRNTCACFTHNCVHCLTTHISLSANPYAVEYKYVGTSYYTRTHVSCCL